MSSQQLNKVLYSVLLILEKNLREELNYEVTEAEFTPSILIDAIIGQLNFTYATGAKKFPILEQLGENYQKDLADKIKIDVGSAMQQLHSEYSKLDKKYKGIKVTVTPTIFNINNPSFIVRAETLNKSELSSVWRGQGNKVLVGSFQSIKEGYRDIIDGVWRKIGDYINTQAKEDKKELTLAEKDSLFKSSGPADLEHIISNSVSQRQINSASNLLITELNKYGRSAGSSKKVLESLGLEFFLDYVATDITTTVKVKVGSKSKNRSQATQEKQVLSDAKVKVRQALILALQPKWPEIAKDWGGSDSRMDIEKKKIVKIFKKYFRKNKNVKSLKTIDTNLKLSKRKSKKGTVSGKTPKVRKLSVSNYKPSVKTKNIAVKQSTKPTLNLNALKAQINARLSMTVIKNMGTPALENRSGRFARSATVTDVIQTSQGFPSIGYTYQKYPYQTFEPGFKQGSTQRDPRTLIDRSIREIASQLIAGRFYTRRT